MNTETTILGYRIEATGDNRPNRVAYRLHGPRATYSLMRCYSKPEYLYPLNSRLNTCAIKGNGWFTDKDGSLRTVNAL